MGHVAELAYTGKDVTADRARQIGLVNEVLPDHEGVGKAATEMAAELAANAAPAFDGPNAVQAGRAASDGAGRVGYLGDSEQAFLPAQAPLSPAVALGDERVPP